MKLIWLIRAVAFLAVIGTVGSVEIDRIDFYTAFLQIALTTDIEQLLDERNKKAR